MTIGYIFGGVAVLVAWFATVLRAHEDGRNTGFTQGWDAAEKWMVMQENAVNEARMELWRQK